MLLREADVALIGHTKIAPFFIRWSYRICICCKETSSSTTENVRQLCERARINRTGKLPLCLANSRGRYTNHSWTLEPCPNAVKNDNTPTVMLDHRHTPTQASGKIKEVRSKFPTRRDNAISKRRSPLIQRKRVLTILVPK